MHYKRMVLLYILDMPSCIAVVVINLKGAIELPSNAYFKLSGYKMLTVNANAHYSSSCDNAGNATSLHTHLHLTAIKIILVETTVISAGQGCYRNHKN